MRISRKPSKNLALGIGQEKLLKNWHPICRDRRQAYLGSSSMIAAALFTELRRYSENVGV